MERVEELLVLLPIAAGCHHVAVDVLRPVSQIVLFAQEVVQYEAPRLAWLHCSSFRVKEGELLKLILLETGLDCANPENC